MRNQLERLLDIAKRLDDMAEDGPSELLTISEEVGKIVESLEDAPRPGPNQKAEMPDWLRAMQRHMENSALEIIAERYRHHASYSGTVTIAIPPYREQEMLRRDAIDYHRLSSPTMEALLKNINGV